MGRYLFQKNHCVKDRLAAFYHWNDRQCLEQALLVAEAKKTDLAEIRRWSAAEKKSAEFQAVRAILVKAGRKRNGT